MTQAEWLSPDCAAGKHGGCQGDAWDNDLDQPAPCGCTCHDVWVERPEPDE